MVERLDAAAPPSGSQSLRAEGLRLALFTDTYMPQLNGVTRTLDRMVSHVRARGGMVQVVTTSSGNGEWQSGDDVERWPSVPFWGYDELRLAPPLVRRARRTLGAFKPNLVHVATPFGIGVAGRRAAHSLGIPLVSSYHTSFVAYASYYGLGSLVRPGFSYLRWFHNGAQRTYCPTMAVQTELSKLGFSNTALWGRGVDTTRFNPRYRSNDLRLTLGARPGDVIVIYVGRLAPEKGLDLALESVRRARAKAGARILLAVAGDGPHAERCHAQAPSGTMFMGRLEGTALSELYASADIFLFPSLTDTFGNVLLEAMASRLAIVAADSAPSRELLAWRDGEHRRGMIAPADPDGIADMLVRLADDASLRRSIAALGHAHAVASSWDDVLDSLIDDYTKVIMPAALHS